MFDRAPSEREILSWLHVIVWSGIIFATIPFARAVLSGIRGDWGREIITYGISAIMAILAIGTLVVVWRRDRPIVGTALLGAVAGLYIYLTFDIGSSNPEEAIHYVEYGVLGVLIYRAFAHRIHDASIYFASILLGTLVGMIDEIIQWIVPGRVFDQRDIWLNLTGVALAQLALAAVFRPRIAARLPGPASWRRLSYLAAVVVGIFGLCNLNTPSLVVWYSQIPGLGFLGNVDEAMTHYGHLYDDPDIGIYRSRLSASELREAEAARVNEGARLFERYHSGADYRELLETVSPIHAPYLHEALVHLRSRDADLTYAREREDEVQRARDYVKAQRENRILEAHFSAILTASNTRWPEEVMAEVDENAPRDALFESLVSRQLITAYTPRQVLVLTAALVFGLFLGGRLAAALARD